MLIISLWLFFTDVSAQRILPVYANCSTERQDEIYVGVANKICVVAVDSGRRQILKRLSLTTEPDVIINAIND
ncbi:MAG TPA: hypothetical protein VKH37_04160, partial [Ferruginibacter sp.]|nr:hypothetical protein [Ferruginibacter sp.]